MVRNYTTRQLLRKARQVTGFIDYPDGFWLLGIRSKEKLYNVYDDKFYLFKGKKFIDVISGTTDSGAYGFKNFIKWNRNGVGEIKSNEWYYDVWRLDKHKGKMDALRQVGWFKIIRRKSPDDVNARWKKEWWKGFNFHCNSYNSLSTFVAKYIGGWSVGCQVTNNRKKYFQKWIPMFKKSKQELYSYVLLDEF